MLSAKQRLVDPCLEGCADVILAEKMSGGRVKAQGLGI